MSQSSFDKNIIIGGSKSQLLHSNDNKGLINVNKRFKE